MLLNRSHVGGLWTGGRFRRCSYDRVWFWNFFGVFFLSLLCVWVFLTTLLLPYLSPIPSFP